MLSYIHKEYHCHNKCYCHGQGNRYFFLSPHIPWLTFKDQHNWCYNDHPYCISNPPVPLRKQEIRH
ncbi:hypothetical protein MBAV_001720 [Candidatus Magnetobacterium bavaricum]|uniref:Uncharacterized protein n=1 Tax=Candidatus Magnetobacterium bavaricum TaxID=29290 RepID=A0A0F3GW17_9BACT|nr:hypothetical protein MBAV_001720 [Candidatus Magnetobacterium bavaricum]